MEGNNIYLSVFPEFLELLSFCLLKLTNTIDLQVMRLQCSAVLHFKKNTPEKKHGE